MSSKPVMSKKLLILGGICISVVLSSLSYASEKQKGITGAQFLKLGIGARAIALGEAFTGIANDVNSLYWNPAGLSQIEKTEILLQHNLWLQNIGYSYFGIAHPLENFGAVGLSIGSLGIKDIEARIAATDKPDYIFGASDLIVGLSYAKSFGSILMGVNLKFIQQKIDAKVDKNTATGYAGDLGALVKTGKVDVGLVVQNIGTEMKFDKEGDKLPTNIKLGIGSDKLVKNLTLGAGVNLPIDNKPNFTIGGEYKLKISEEISIPLRAGFKVPNDIENVITTGFGIGFNKFNLDLAWIPLGYGDLGQIYSVSLIVKF